MNTSLVLEGITQQTIQTPLLTVAYLEAGTGTTPVVLIHGNCSSSLFFQDLMLALAASQKYTIYAPDMRGYGDSATLPVDATRGMKDFSDDLEAFVQSLALPAFHLLGWSLGGNVVMQYLIDYPGKVRSLILESPGSPFGFGGSKGIEGSLIWPDGAGSGGGTANSDFVQRLAQGDRGNEQTSPRTVMNTFYFKPPFRAAPDREEIYLSSMLAMKVSDGNYPGDITPSQNWPNVAPGTKGVNNALSPLYLHQDDFATINPQPPILWIRGANDQIVADQSLFDLGFLGQLGAVPGWPGADVYPAQPMVSQVRLVLDNYQANGGHYSEIILADCGHSPHIEKQTEFLEFVTDFLREQ